MSVILTRGIRFADGDTVPGSYVWSFSVKVDDGSGSFVRVRDIGVGSNPYDIALESCNDLWGYNKS